ncbi:unnamed protein product [Candidula unifasciata]|uniref:Uncharacterized protein n=1 Tax=Candidula unifasciata TaxID=100452 RepID=A0A8S3YXP2_9EUPU|nr:unnamed protein product [Candidula unifasciata]
MITTAMFPLIFGLVSSLVILSYIGQGDSAGSSSGQGEIMYEWLVVEYDWPSETMRRQFEADCRYNASHNLISGIKTYKLLKNRCCINITVFLFSLRGQVYLSVPRLKYTTGVPSTLNKVIQKGNQSVLTPFPDWASQELGNCSALQCAMSMEVDPITGYMYVIDPGRSGIFGDISGQPPPVICPPKLVVYNLNDGSLVRSHDFPEDLVSNKTNFLNDIVIDRGSPTSKSAKWVYITDAVDSKLIHESMDYEEGDGSNITVNGISYILKTPIDGLAMSSDFEYVYYCALGKKGADFGSKVRLVGEKASQTGGMTYATDNLYYGALTKNSVYKWEIKTETEILKDDEKLEWPDSFTVDEDGFLWFTACRAQLFLLGGIDFSGVKGANFRVWRVSISENGYLAPRVGQLRGGNGVCSWSGALVNVIPALVLAWR